MRASGLGTVMKVVSVLRNSRAARRTESRCSHMIYPTSIIHDPLFLQLLQKLADVGANLFRVRGGELLLQFADDLAEGALAVALLQNLATGALQLDGAFGEEDHANLFPRLALRTPSASGREAGLTGV